jgi:hypothetical protein
MLHAIFLVANDQIPLSNIWFLMVLAFIPEARCSPISRNTDFRSEYSTQFDDRNGGGMTDTYTQTHYGVLLLSKMIPTALALLVTNRTCINFFTHAQRLIYSSRLHTVV